MADIDVEELLRNGGQEDEVDVESLLSSGGQVREAPSGVESAVGGFGQGVSLGLGDEYEGLRTAGTGALALGARAVADGDLDALTNVPEQALGLYRGVRDARRATNRQLEEANPNAYGGGRVGGAVASGIITGAAGAAAGVGAGLRGAVALGAGEGAVDGFGSSEADLTVDDAREYARAFGDTLKGGAAGAAGGGIGYGVGRALKWGGDKAAGALGRARRELADEVGVARSAEDDALRAADVEQQRKLAVAQEAAGKMDRARARELAREAVAQARQQRQRGGPAVDPNAEPDTGVLVGYGRGARKLRKDNAREVLDARERLARQDITPEERAELEAYVQGHGDAVDNPVAFRLRSIEENLRKRYPRDVAQRLMARFDAQGNAVSRRAAQSAVPTPQVSAPLSSAPKPTGSLAEHRLLPERTQLQDADDWARRGQFERAGGGGSALDGLQEAPTRVDREAFPSSSQLYRDALRRQVEIEDLPPYMYANGPGEGRRLTPQENMDLMAQMRVPEDTVPHYGGPMRSREEMLPGNDDFQLGQPDAPVRVSPLTAPPAARPGASYERYGQPRRQPGMPPEEVAQVDEMLAARRAAAAGAQAGNGTPRPSAGEGTRGMGPQGAPAAVPASAPETTRATAVPEVRRPAPPPRPREVRLDGTTRYGPPPLEQRLAARPSVEDVAGEREKGALLQLGLAGYEGARRAHNFVAAPVGALVGITKEAMGNPAVRARAISLFKLERLARVRPDVYARVGSMLSRAQEKGPERYAAARHTLLLRDPAFRAAEAEADKELESLDDEALVETLSGAR